MASEMKLRATLPIIFFGAAMVIFYQGSIQLAAECLDEEIAKIAQRSRPRVVVSVKEKNRALRLAADHSKRFSQPDRARAASLLEVLQAPTPRVPGWRAEFLGKRIVLTGSVPTLVENDAEWNDVYIRVVSPEPFNPHPKAVAWTATIAGIVKEVYPDRKLIVLEVTTKLDYSTESST